MKRRWPEISGVAASLALLGWVLYSVAQNWEQGQVSALDFSAVPLLVSAFALFVAYWIRAGLYSFLLNRLDPGTSTVVASRIFFASQAGRYLPGKVWQFVGAGMLAGLHGASATAAVWTSTVIAILHHLIGLLIALLIVRRFTDAQMEMAAGIIALGIGGLMFLSSNLAPRWIEWIAHRIGREPARVARESWPSFKLLAAMAPCFALVWGLFGLALERLVAATLAPEGAISLGQASSIMAASCVAGYVVLIAPSGLGVREATMTGLLAPILGLPASGMIAIAMRIEMTLVDGLLMAWGLTTLPRSGESRAQGRG